jgi:hypothetical protein
VADSHVVQVVQRVEHVAATTAEAEHMGSLLSDEAMSEVVL